MSTDKKSSVTENKAGTEKEVKKNLPIKNNATDHIKNTASQTNGLNQVKTSRDDLFPSDGDNLTQ